MEIRGQQTLKTNRRDRSAACAQLRRTARSLPAALPLLRLSLQMFPFFEGLARTLIMAHGRERGCDALTGGLEHETRIAHRLPDVARKTIQGSRRGGNGMIACRT